VIVGLGSHHQDGVTAWAWASENGLKGGGLFVADGRPPPEVQGLVAALDEALAAHGDAAELDVRVPDERVAAALAEFGSTAGGGALAAALRLGSSSTPLLQEWQRRLGRTRLVTPWRNGQETGVLVLAARRLARSLVRAAVGEPAPARLTPARVRIEVDGHPLTIATDGSKGRGPGGSWGWVSDHGHYGHGTTSHGEIVGLELRAVLAALEAVDRRQPLELLVDSRAALNEIESVYVYRREGWLRRGRPVKHRELLEAIDVELRGRPARLSWVPAHRGIELNECAHRMALLARRAHDTRYGGPPYDAATFERLARGIATDAIGHGAVRVA
jgi:ribonuclease HI